MSVVSDVISVKQILKVIQSCWEGKSYSKKLLLNDTK